MMEVEVEVEWRVEWRVEESEREREAEREREKGERLGLSAMCNDGQERLRQSRDACWRYESHLLSVQVQVPVMRTIPSPSVETRKSNRTT